VSSTLSREGAIDAPALESTVAPHPHLKERLLSLDVFRGLTIAGMLLVNNPGTWSAIYPPLEHAEWHGWTPTDLIFPFFLFIVGITTHLSLTSRRKRGASDGEIVRQILKRGGLIILAGLLLGGFPYHEFVLRLPFGVVFDSATPQIGISTWRITGVLQRIGVAYIFAALLTMHAPTKRTIAIIAVLLVGYWIAMTLIPVPGYGLGMYTLGRPEATLGAWLDRAVIGTNHMWRGSKTWDPEGILSTVPAIGTAMLGVLAGRWIGSKRALIDRVAGLFAVGAIGMMVGLIWNWVFPINKNLWTSSFVLFTAGLACVTLATCMWLIDVQGRRGWTKPFVIFGVNPLFAFIGEGFLSRLIYTLVKVPYGGDTVSVQSAIYRSAYASWLTPRNASLLFALTYVLVFFWIMRELYRRDIVIKV
jgi:predicted acyltransferase